MSESHTERIGPGICDACGEHAPALTAIYSAPVAGMCICDECLKPRSPDALIHSPLGTQPNAIGGRDVVLNPTTICYADQLPDRGLIGPGN